ncbi:uncharacterized protein LOC117634771 [Prunus dulcis]|uniref:uncharacterized protein LOC117634771 n=1 Tax=Prunus dulcis TaxID=3755 RepID=UPI001481D65B|nr:uncharacterized protein LOC117634771 [Prunus dulcis]
MTFLFANSSSTLHWKIVEHCVNLDTLSSYLWARVVSTYINDSLIKKFLLCERTNIIQPILRKEKEIPTILKWSLVELHTRFNQIEDLNDIESIFKTPKKRKTIREEKYPVDKNTKAKEQRKKEASSILL